jgi:hypothetical protein
MHKILMMQAYFTMTSLTGLLIRGAVLAEYYLQI